MVNIRFFLLGFLALAIIGGAVAGGMYYRSLMVARAEKKRIADEYYFRDFRFNFACHFAYPLLGGHISEIDKLKERMHKDGYSYAEIGIIAEKARRVAHDDYLDEMERQQALKNDQNA